MLPVLLALHVISHLLVLQAIYTLGPLLIAVSVNSSSLSRYNNEELLSGRTGSSSCSTESDGSLSYNHGVLVVGYQNSTKLADGTAGGGSFIIKNSWNTDWGVTGATTCICLSFAHLSSNVRKQQAEPCTCASLAIVIW